MVEVPRSTGCRNCRMKKKKCGEERPSCLACLSMGLKRRQHYKQWRFIDETTSTANIYGRQRYALEETDVHSPCWSSGREIVWPLNPHASLLAYILDDPRCRTIFPLASHGRFYSEVPSRLGRNVALDSAVACLCSAYMEALRVSSIASSTMVIRGYMRSLQALRTVLDNARFKLDPETLCASIVLQVCELLIGTGFAQWNQLFLGSRCLIQQWGPGRFRTSFDIAMFESLCPFMLAQDITLRQTGFLAQLDWRDLIRRHASLDATKKLTVEARLRWTLSTQLIEIPSYLAVASRLMDPQSTEAKPVDYLNMARCMLTLRERFQSCYVEELAPQLIAGDRRKYSNIFAAIIDFVSNIALTQMEGTYCRLLSSQSSRLSGDHYLCDLLIRQQTMVEAIAFVRQSSKAAAKPLEHDHQSLDVFTMVKSQSENARMKLGQNQSTI